MWTAEKDLSWASSILQRVEGLPSIIKEACGCDFLVAEAEEGTFWALGDNLSGQLGHFESVLQPTPNCPKAEHPQFAIEVESSVEDTLRVYKNHWHLPSTAPTRSVVSSKRSELPGGRKGPVFGVVLRKWLARLQI